MTTGDAPRRRRERLHAREAPRVGWRGLAKLEVQRGRQEMTAEPRAPARLASSSSRSPRRSLVAFLIGLLAFIIAVLVVIGLWWVALIVVLACWRWPACSAWRGIKQVTSTKFTPEETIASVKEDIAWAKTRLLRRD